MILFIYKSKTISLKNLINFAIQKSHFRTGGFIFPSPGYTYWILKYHITISAYDMLHTSRQTIEQGRQKDIFCMDSIVFEHRELHIWGHIYQQHFLWKHYFVIPAFGLFLIHKSMKFTLFLLKTALIFFWPVMTLRYEKLSCLYIEVNKVRIYITLQ